LTALVVDDVDDQVDDYLARVTTPPADALHVLLVGGNDVARALDAGSSAGVVASATTLVDQIERLAAAGADRFLVPNLPDVGSTPRFVGTSDQAAARSFTAAFNETLASELDAFLLATPGVELFTVDLFGLFDDLLADPSAFGLTNVMDEAAPDLTPGDQSYDTTQIVPNPDQYLFWDDFHPTATGHALIAQTALAAIPEPGSLVVLAAGVTLLLRRRAA
jgi:phospholipase/lecithinase/hemolysin